MRSCTRMSVLGFLFHLALLGLAKPSSSKDAPTGSASSMKLFPCFTAEQQSVEDECLDMANIMAKQYYVESMSYCIDETEATKGMSMRQTCEARFFKQVYITYSDCVLSKIGAKEISTDPVDLKSFSDATIGTTTLANGPKSAAMVDFNACMAANYSIPFVHFSYKRDKNPAILRQFIEDMNKNMNFGQQPPTPSIMAMDCLASALIQNGCAPSSEEAVVKLGQKRHPSSVVGNTNPWLECLSDDYQWYHDVCGALAWSELAPLWIQDCTRSSGGGDNSCRIKRMKQFLEFMADCSMVKNKAVNTTYFFKKFNKKDPELFKEMIIGGSALPDNQKKAAMAFFDTCMAENVTLPYKMFPYSPEKVPGPPITKDIMNRLNAIFSIGNQTPTYLMRADDCLAASLLLNGCNAKKSNENAMKIYTDLAGLDKLFNVLNAF